MAITKEQALTGDYFHYRYRDMNKCEKWRRNGKTKTWVRSPQRWELPVKHGLYDYELVTDKTSYLPWFWLENECPYCNDFDTAWLRKPI